jgi:hypothetical protein
MGKKLKKWLCVVLAVALLVSGSVLVSGLKGKAERPEQVQAQAGGVAPLKKYRGLLSHSVANVPHLHH